MSHFPCLTSSFTDTVSPVEWEGEITRSGLGPLWCPVEAEGVCLCVSFLPAVAPSLPPSLPNQKPDLHFPLQKVPGPSHKN